LEDTAQWLGKGAFGEVTEVVDFMNAKIRAKKTFENDK